MQTVVEDTKALENALLVMDPITALALMEDIAHRDTDSIPLKRSKVAAATWAQYSKTFSKMLFVGIVVANHDRLRFLAPGNRHPNDLQEVRDLIATVVYLEREQQTSLP